VNTKYRTQRITLAVIVFAPAVLCLLAGDFLGLAVLLILGMITSTLQDIASR